MYFKSLKTNIYVFLVAIFIQLLLTIGHFYLHKQTRQIEKENLAFAKTEQLFLETLAYETTLQFTEENSQNITLKLQTLLTTITTNRLDLDITPIQRRLNLNQQLQTQWRQREALHKNLNSTMPNLSSSVSYIHEHHVTYLKNRLYLQEKFQPPTAQESFTRSDIHPGTELNIILAAINVQNSLLEIFEIFTRLQRGHSTVQIDTDFSNAIKQFYAATNHFEDFSLDAQDGLLVEELLLNGYTFENSFKQFLTLEQSITQLHKKLRANSKSFLENFTKAKLENKKTHHRIERNIMFSKNISLSISILMLLGVLLIGKNIITALRKTVDETKRIQNDLAHRIPADKKNIREYEIIFKALNLMGDTVKQKVVELERAKGQLSERVTQRTLELSEANEQLRKELNEKNQRAIERRTLEEKLNRAQKMEAIGTLAGGVAHDLNNILSGIVSYPEIILMDLPEDHKLRPIMETIKTSGEKAAIIVQDLLTMARRGVASQDPLEINSLIKDFLNSPEFNAIARYHPHVVVECNLSPNVGTIQGSAVHITKTLANLIANGAESITNHGKLVISTSNRYIDTPFGAYDHMEEGEYVKITIQDNGMGISPENLDRVFEPFFTTKSMGRSGSGLGMAVVWGTVKDHGGYIDITSTKMVGTTFDLYFPRFRIAAEYETRGLDKENIHAKGESILVVDDIKEQRDIASLMLNRLGYKVKTVNSGEKAIDFCRYNKVDILILDMIMDGGIDGLETYREIIKIHPRQKAIIVSGFSESEKVTEAQKLGTGPYLKKPYSLLELGSLVRKELDKG